MAEYEKLDIEPIQLAKPDEYQFATRISSRRPEFKVHRTLGQAHAAISYRTRGRGYQLQMTDECILYRRNDEEGVWQAEHHFPYQSVWRHLPWQPDPGSPEERRKADQKTGILRSLDSLVWDIQHQRRGPLEPDKAAQIMRELEKAKKAVSDILS